MFGWIVRVPWWAWTAAYVLGSVVVTCYLLYTAGLHYGQKHGGKRQPRTCEAPECANTGCILSVVFLFWPPMLLLYFVCSFFEMWCKAGVNAGLPVEGQHPTAKPVDCAK